MMSGACVGSFLVDATASCAVAGCPRGARPALSLRFSLLVVSVLRVSFIRLMFVAGLVVVVAESDV